MSYEVYSPSLTLNTSDFTEYEGGLFMRISSMSSSVFTSTITASQSDVDAYTDGYAIETLYTYEFGGYLANGNDAGLCVAV